MEGTAIDMSSPPPSFIKGSPEFVKLIFASLLVALSLHAYFSARRNKIDELRRGPNVNGRVGAVGSSIVNADSGVDNCIRGDGEGSNGSINNGSEWGQLLGSSVASSEAEDDNSSKKKKTISRNDVSNRNYDALISKKAEDEDEEGSQKQKKASGKSYTKTSTDSDPIEETDNQPTDATSLEGIAPDQQEPAPPPPIALKSQTNHPGLQGYYNWHSTITSLYRIYAIPSRDNISNTYHQAILPMHPSSERGQVPLYIEVTNRTSHPKIDVYWIDYKGNEIYKGSISNRGGVWTQTTFIGHPWTFRVGPGEENVLLKYAPFRVIPSIAGAETSRVEQGGNVEGMQKFTLRDVREGHVTLIDGLTPMCLVEDAILPEPPLIDTYKLGNTASSKSAFSSKEMDQAIQWSCQQMQREDAIYHGNGIASANRLLQYLKNVCLHPDDAKYRKLRLGNRIFQQTIYNTGARGVLLALGFEELYGHMEMGPGGGKMLPHERIQQISDAMMVVNRALKVMEEGSNGPESQPVGGDGFGRAGFGHAGGMNL